MILAGGAVILYLAFALGRRCLLLTGCRFGTVEEWAAASLAGFGILAYAVLILGLSGLLTALTLSVLLAGLAVTSFVSLKQDISLFGKILVPRGILKNPFNLAVLFLAAAALLAGLAGVLAPETANDSLCYHVNLPKIYLQAGRIFHVPYDTNSPFPLLMEMLYTLALAFRSMSLAKFFHFSTALLTAGLIASTVRRYSGSIQAGIGSAILFITTPVILNQLGTTYVDAALGAFGFVSFIFLLRWAEDPERQTGFLTLAGIFAGFALSVKYLALISILISGFLILWVSFSRKPSSFFKNFLLFSVPVLIFGGYWYLRAWIETGNPVYPYFASIFGSGDASVHYDDIGVPRTFISFLTAFWKVTMNPQLFEGFGVQIGPGYLAFLPLSFAVTARNTSLRWMWAYAFLFFTAWFLLGQSLRFLAPVLPVLAVLIGCGFADLKKSWAEKLFKVLLVLTLALHAVLGVYHYRRDFKTAAGRETASDYLNKYERSYRMAEYVNSNLPPGAVILNADETHMFYFQRKMIRETVYVLMGENYWADASSPAGVIQNLKKRGFTHILRAARTRLLGKSFEDQPLRIFSILDTPQNQLASVLNPLYTYSFTDEEGIEFTYKLYEIL